jgi:hypothetical protein
MTTDIWLLFDKSQYGKKYAGQVITNKPMKAISFESAYLMYTQGKAVETKAPKPEKIKTPKK